MSRIEIVYLSLLGTLLIFTILFIGLNEAYGAKPPHLCNKKITISDVIESTDWSFHIQDIWNAYNENKGHFKNDFVRETMQFIAWDVMQKYYKTKKIQKAKCRNLKKMKKQLTI